MIRTKYPDTDAFRHQRYDLNELESAAVFAVTEVEDVGEIFKSITGVNITVHSPEANWSDPVRMTENLEDGAMLIGVDFGDIHTAVMIPEDDASLLAGLLNKLSGAALTKAIKKGLTPEFSETLMGLFTQVFAAKGGKVGVPKVLKSSKDNIADLEAVLGPSFLGVRVSVSPKGFSEGYIYRLYDTVFVEKHFRSEVEYMGMATQVMPATSHMEAVEETQETKPAARREKARPKAKDADIVDKLRRIPIVMRVQLASRRMKMRDVLKLLPGEVIEFEKKVKEPSDVMVNSHMIAGAEIVRSGQKYGIKLQRIASVKDRLKSLGD